MKTINNLDPTIEAAQQVLAYKDACKALWLANMETLSTLPHDAPLTVACKLGSDQGALFEAYRHGNFKQLTADQWATISAEVD